MSEIRIGIIGLDTSHVNAFTDIINNSENQYHVPGGKVVAAFPGGTPGLDISMNRVEGFTSDLQEKYGVEIVDSIGDLEGNVDAILLESVDGGMHLEQFKAIADFGLPVFIDKPLANSLEDALKIKVLAEEKGVPVMSSSSLRYDAALVEALGSGNGEITGGMSYGPAAYQDGFPGLFWYGIHSAELLFAIMGKGCESVTCAGDDNADVAVGRWSDGRTGTLIGNRKGAAGFGGFIFRDGTHQPVVQHPDIPFYAGLVKKIMELFETKTPPVSMDETIEVIAFLEAANTSRDQDGKPINILG